MKVLYNLAFLVAIGFTSTFFAADDELPDDKLPIDRFNQISNFQPEARQSAVYWRGQIDRRRVLNELDKQETEERKLQQEANDQARKYREQQERITFDQQNLADLKRMGKETFFVWLLRKNATSVEDVSFFFGKDVIRCLYEKSIDAMIRYIFSDPHEVCIVQSALLFSLQTKKEWDKLEVLPETERSAYKQKGDTLRESFYKAVLVAVDDPQFVDTIQQAEIGTTGRIERDTSFTRDPKSGWPNYQRYLSKRTINEWACVIS